MSRRAGGRRGPDRVEGTPPHLGTRRPFRRRDPGRRSSVFGSPFLNSSLLSSPPLSREDLGNPIVPWKGSLSYATDAERHAPSVQGLSRRTDPAGDEHVRRLADIAHRQVSSLLESSVGFFGGVGARDGSGGTGPHMTLRATRQSCTREGGRESVKPVGVWGGKRDIIM